ncbi:MAG TPA: glycosyltransferase family 4 protein [Gemmatimonadaceae bacterium]
MSQRGTPRLTVLYMDIGRDWRGGQRQILWMGEGLLRHGGRPIFALRPGAPLGERARAAGIEVVEIDPAFAEFGPWTVLRLRRLVRRERVAILHPQSGHTMALAALAAAGTGAKIVFARRTSFAMRDDAGTRLKYGRADRIISVSRAGLEALVRAGLDPARMEVIPSGIHPLRDTVPASAATLASFGVPSGAPLVVMVGALTGVKDPLTFARAVAAARRRVRALHALLVGEGPLRAAVEAEARTLGIADALHLTGFRADTESLIAAADVACLTSTSEGTPGVLIDALALARPIVATAVGGVSEVVIDGESGLLAPAGDAGALGEAIARVLGDPLLAARLSEGAHARAREFTIDRTVSRTIAVYERLLAGKDGP